MRLQQQKEHIEVLHILEQLGYLTRSLAEINNDVPGIFVLGKLLYQCGLSHTARPLYQESRLSVI